MQSVPHLFTFCIQVASMVGYAVGEILPDPSEDLHSTEDELSRWTPRAKDSCYEVVTAWTHPR